MQKIKNIIKIATMVVALVAFPFAGLSPSKATAAVGSTVTRSFSTATPSPGSNLTVSLAVNIVPPDTFYAIDEVVPAGWVISNPGTGDTSQAGHIKWLVITGAITTAYQYAVTVPATSTGVNTFSGTYGTETIVNPVAILGETSVNLQAQVPVLTTITVTPAAPSIQTGATQQFTATALDQNGTAMNPQPTFAWTSSNNLLATVDANGLATGVSAGGPVIITATSGTIFGSASLMVTAPPVVPVLTSVGISPTSSVINVGATQQLTATPLDQNNTVFVGATTTWLSMNPSLATVNANGLVTAVATGTVYIVATAISGTTTVSGTSTITVNLAPPVLTTIIVSPSSTTVNVGGSYQFTATTLDQYGASITSTVVWNSSNLVAGAINSTGLFSALGVGTTTITASVGTTTGNALVTVVALSQGLAITQIAAIQTFATPDNTYANGWKWVLNVTAPSDEINSFVKFSDWVLGGNTIPAANNIRYFSAQSSNANSEATAINITASATYPTSSMILAGDMDSTAPGRQIQIAIEAKVPVGSAPGSYTTSYGIKTQP